MASEPVYGAVPGEDDLPELASLVNHAFAGPLEGSADWLRTAGLQHVRVLREAGRPVASLLRIPMGQYFGGRSVPMMGVAGVAVAPEARGRGLARRLMQQALLEMHSEGWPISSLYASTQSLYRQVGYEQAGHRFMIRVPLSQIDVRDRSASVVPLADRSAAEVESCYRDFACAQQGWLDRGDYCWARVRELRSEPYHGFGVEEEGRLSGYVYFLQRRKDTGRHDVITSDLVFRTPQAGRRLLGFLADFATIGEDAVVFGGPHHPLLWLLGQQRFSVTLRDYWMTRLTDVARALEGRGYPSSVSARVELDVADPLIAKNAGRWVLSVEQGRGIVEKGGGGDVRIDARTLAALWSGFATPEQLRLLGAIDGSDSALAAAGAVFASGTPAMSDMF